MQSHKSQWVTAWTDSPLAGGKTFPTMSPTERLTLLRALVLWAMSSSKAVRDIIDHAYKGKRKDDDSNISVSVQPWGNDSDKRRYYLVEGRDDMAFRVYRESNPAGFINRTWWSVAGSIDDIKALIEKLETNDGGPKARKLAKRLADEIPRFEATEEVRFVHVIQPDYPCSLTMQKRRRREYRQQQRDRFKRPEPGFSLYEGRTRGKRIKYTYSDDEDFLTDSTGPRRSTRHSDMHMPNEPVTTASGRLIRAPNRLNDGGLSASVSVQGDAALDGEAGTGAEGEDDSALSVGPTGRPRRSAAVNHGRNGWAKARQQDEYDEYDSQAEEEDSEPDLGDDEEEDEDEHVPDEEDEDEEDDDEVFDQDKDAMLLDADEESELGGAGGSVMVKLPVKAVLDQETGKWEKGALGASDAPSGPQRLSGASTPINGAVDIDVPMTGSTTTQSSDVTATSPVQQMAAATALADVSKDGNVPPKEDAAGAKDAAPAAAVAEDGAAAAPSSPGQKENSVPTPAALAYRGSPEKTANRAVGAVGN